MEKIALYCRVSTVNQSKAETVDTQLNALLPIYKGRKVQIYKEQISGSEFSRPVLNKLIEDASKGLFKTVGVYHIDRLTRSTAFYYYLKENLFKKYNISLEVMGRPLTESPDDVLRGGFDALIAEATKLRIVMGMMDGKKSKAERGELLGCKPPYGFRLIKRNREKGTQARFVIDQKEAEMVKEMFNIYLRENSIKQTARKLQAMGVIGRNGKPIDIKTVAKMLRNENYIGNHYWGMSSVCEAKYHLKKERKAKLTGRKVKPREEWKLVKVPAIVDKKIFDRVQRMLKKRKSEYLKPTKYHFLCQSIIKCVECGRTYFGKRKSLSNRQQRKTGDHFAYVCPQKFGVKLGEKRCHAREMSIRKLDGRVWGKILKIVYHPEEFTESLKYALEENAAKEEDNRKIFSGLISQKDNLKNRKSKLLDLYIDNRYSREDLDAKLAELNSEEETLNRSVEETEAKLEKIKYNNMTNERIRQYLGQFRDGIENKTFEEKKAIVRDLIKEINILKDGKVIIKGVVEELPVLKMNLKRDLVSVGSGVIQDTQYL